MKANKIARGQVVSNHRRRKDKESESNIDSAAHIQALKQQKQLNGRNHHIPININTECQQTHSPSKDTICQTGLKRKTHNLCLQETHLLDRNKHWLKAYLQSQ
jgi:hypothetical protein